MIYTRLAVTPSDPERRDAVSAALFAAGAEGLVEDGAKFVTLFADDAAATLAIDAARGADPAVHAVRESYDPGDWNAAWRAGVAPHRVGKFVITPPWRVHEIPDAIPILIEPAMGFGTGEHETTRLALAFLQSVVRAGDVVVDAGCGSGVLAIAAAQLGARQVTAIEIDALAISNAEENVALNGVGGIVSVIEGDAGALLPLLAPVRVVVANIIATVLLELLPSFAQSMPRDGELIVGGILRTERDAFVGDAGALGWTVQREDHAGDWWSALMTRVSA